MKPSRPAVGTAGEILAVTTMVDVDGRLSSLLQLDAFTGVTLVDVTPELLGSANFVFAG